MKTLLTILISIPLLASTAWGATYYVSPTGDDLAIGTSPETAWKTPQRANIVGLSPGDSIVVGGSPLEPLRGTLKIISDGTLSDPIQYRGPGSITSSYNISHGENYKLTNLVINANTLLTAWTNSTTPSIWSPIIAGASTVNQDSVGSAFGGSCARIDVDGSANLSYLRLQQLWLPAEKTRLTAYYKATEGASGRIDVRNETTGNYMQSNGAWGASLYRPLFPASTIWAEYHTPIFIPEATGNPYRIQLFPSTTANASVYFQGFVIDIYPEWKEYDAENGVYYINHYTAKNTLQLLKSTKSEFAVLGLDGLNFVKQAASLEVISEGEYFYDGTERKIYYRLATGEASITDLHIECTMQSYTLWTQGDYVEHSDIRVYGGHDASIFNDGSANVFLERCFASRSRIYGGRDGNGAIATWQDCEFYKNNDLEAETYASNGYLNDASTAVLERCISHWNGDDGFQNYGGGDLELISCVSQFNLSTQFTNSGGTYRIYNCTFRSGFEGGQTEFTFHDQDATNPAREIKNTVIYHGRDQERAVYVQGANNSSLVSDHNLYFGGLVNGFIGTNTDPLFISDNNSRLLATSPCKNAGVDVGLTTDFLGKPIRGLPDIGAYEIQPTGGSSFGNFNFSFGW